MVDISKSDGSSVAKSDGVEKISLVKSSWFVLAVLTAVYSVTYMNRMVFALLMPQVSSEFHFSDTQLGQLTGLAFPFVYGVAGMVFSIAADRMNRVKLIVLSVSSLSAMTMACGAAQGFWTMFLSRLGLGIVEAGPNPANLSLLSDHFKGPARQIANSVYGSATSFGLLGAFVALGNVSAWFGWRIAFVSAGSVSFIVAICAMLFLREHRQLARSSVRLRDLADFPALFRIRSYRRIAIAAFLYNMCIEASMQWFPMFLSRSIHMTLANISWFLGVNYSVMGLLGIAAGGAVAAKLRQRSVGGSQLVGAATLVLLPLTFQVVTFSRDPNAVLVALAFFIFLSSTPYGALLAFIQDITPADSHGKASAILFFLMAVGSGVGSLLIGSLSDALASQMGSESLRFSLLALVTGSGLLSAANFFLASRSGDRDAQIAASPAPVLDPAFSA